MPTIFRGAAWAVLVFCVPSLPAAAAPPASPATKLFLDNLVPNVDFLDRSARLALEHAGSKRLKAFAEAEAREQTAAIDAVYDWTQGRPPLGKPAKPTRFAGAATKPMVSKRSVAVAKTLTTPAEPPAVKPAVANATPGLDATPTGSIRVAWPPPATTPPEVDPRLPRGQEDLDALGGLDGAEFDTDFRDKQKDALAQVVADYTDYLAKGDDPALLALAKAQLPKVQARLKALGKV